MKVLMTAASLKTLSLTFLAPVCAAWLLTACPDDDTPTPSASADASIDAAPAPAQDAARPSEDTALAPDEGVTATADAGPTLPDHQGVVVVHSDYKTTSVSLLDRNGVVLADDCLNSGSVTAALMLPLSGDVVTASQPQPNHDVVIIDRGNAAISYLSPLDCSVSRQWSVATGFMANPHDVLGISAKKTYVTRYAGNAKATPTPDDFDDGNDVLIIDPTTGKPTGRVALASYATKGAGGAATLPRPDRMVRIGGLVYVSLNNLSADYSAAGPGRVVVIDPNTDAVTGTIDPPGLNNCGSLQPVPGRDALVMACGGNFADGDKQIDGAGAAWIDLTVSPPSVTIVPSKSFGARVLSGFSIAAVDAGRAFAVTNGDFGGPAPDQLWAFGFAGAAPTKIYDALDSFTLGDLLIDAAAGRMFVLDASTTKPAVQVFDVHDPAHVTLLASVPTSVKRGLPPRSGAWY